MASAPEYQSVSSFRAEREAGWLEFQALLDRAERRSPRALSEEELLLLPTLYRSTLSSLSVARAISLDAGLIAYLEALTLRGYLFIYGVKEGIGKRTVRFFVADWPRAVLDLWRETWVSFALMIIGAVAGYRLVAANPAWFEAMVPGQLAGGRGPGASAEALRAVLYGGGEGGYLSGFAVMLFVHNTQVSLMAFALGFALAIPTSLLVLLNGCLLGAFLQIYVAKGLGFELVGWLSIHGTTELFAITIAGAAGMRIGTRVAFPGAQTRLAAAARAGRVSATAMLGVMVMLFIAGLLEGIGRQRITLDAARYSIGGAMLLLWLGYFYVLPRMTHGPR
ncbi:MULTISPECIES: stage II sporulation protein M [Sphingomonas]|uniref:stage II sporulation protein M n=1 Tax=Sphingomonas TaxID=13687 RepID=UPI000830220A|nr:stage II sporulation protein M [Sphingomonas sp. CCH10-B3]